MRQLGIPPELAAAHLLAQAADDYVKGDKSRADKSRENLLALAASACSQVAQQDHERHVQKLTRKLIQELDTCMLAYFGFHWHHAGLLIEQVGAAAIALAGKRGSRGCCCWGLVHGSLRGAVNMIATPFTAAQIS